MGKKILVSVVLCLAAIFSISSLISQPVLAKNESYVNGDCTSFLGFTSWNCGVNITDQNTLKDGIWLIAANILTDITIAAGYLVVLYVIYGGYLYIFSAGDPSKVATGKKALSQAFIGLAITMSANLIMSSFRFALLGNSPLSANGNPSEVFTHSIEWIIGVAGIVAAIFVVYGGIAYMSSAGEPTKLQKAKSIILYALIGLAIVALAEVITAYVAHMIREADNNASSTNYINQTITKKETHETTSC